MSAKRITRNFQVRIWKHCGRDMCVKKKKKKKKEEEEEERRSLRQLYEIWKETEENAYGLI